MHKKKKLTLTEEEGSGSNVAVFPLLFAIAMHSFVLSGYALTQTHGGDEFDRNRMFLALLSPVTIGVTMLTNMGVLMLFRGGKKYAGSILTLLSLTGAELLIAILLLPIPALF